jgi:transposase-like protein
LFEQLVEQKPRKRIAVDENELTVNSATIYVWGAVDLANKKVIAVWFSLGRNCLEAMIFLKKSRAYLKGRLS